MSKLEIVISGTAGSGKTTIAKIVADALAARGFKPTIEDQEKLSVYGLVHFSERQEQRIRSLTAKNPSVQIRVEGQIPQGFPRGSLNVLGGKPD